MTQFCDEEARWMQRALTLAKRGWGLTNPNPLVGAVLVKDSVIISEGWHTRYGAPHAEVEALKGIDDATGATLYVTLEPCNHTGKTPPCTELILQKKVSRVVYAVSDPNPPACGGGKRLKEAGVEVACGLLEREATQLNEIFFHYIMKKSPFILAKYAMTLDGKIATRTGDSRWISGEVSRRETHSMRQRYGAILIGIGTVLTDNPELSVRDWDGEKKHPLRVVLDSHCRMPSSAKLLKNLNEQPTLVVVSDTEPFENYQHLIAVGAEVVAVPSQNNGLDLGVVLKFLGEKGIDSVLVEGGSQVHGSFLDHKLINRVAVFVAPKLIGGNGASPISGFGIEKMAQAVELKDVETNILEQDVYITGTPVYKEGE